MTYVPHPVFGTNGVTVPQESEIIAGLEAMFQGAFGGDINLSPATPQGQLIASIAEIGRAHV